MLFWMARSVMRPRRRSSCDQTVLVVSNRQFAKTLFWVTSPLTVPFAFLALLGGINALVIWLVSEWRKGPIPATLVVLGVAAAVALIVVAVRECLKPKPLPPLPPPDFPPWEQLGGGGPTPPNPAKWSDRR